MEEEGEEEGTGSQNEGFIRRKRSLILWRVFGRRMPSSKIVFACQIAHIHRGFRIVTYLVVIVTTI